MGREDLSSGSYRDSGFASISAESQQQWARHFLLGHNLETKEVGRDKGGRGSSTPTPVESYFCTHWIPTTPWVPAAFLLMPVSSIWHLCAISHFYHFWANISPACGVHTSHSICRAPEADALGHPPSVRTSLYSWPDSILWSGNENPCKWLAE